MNEWMTGMDRACNYPIAAFAACLDGTIHSI